METRKPRERYKISHKTIESGQKKFKNKKNSFDKDEVKNKQLLSPYKIHNNPVEDRKMETREPRARYKSFHQATGSGQKTFKRKNFTHKNDSENNSFEEKTEKIFEKKSIHYRKNNRPFLHRERKNQTDETVNKVFHSEKSQNKTFIVRGSYKKTNKESLDSGTQRKESVKFYKKKPNRDQFDDKQNFQQRPFYKKERTNQQGYQGFHEDKKVFYKNKIRKPYLIKKTVSDHTFGEKKNYEKRSDQSNFEGNQKTNNDSLKNNRRNTFFKRAEKDQRNSNKKQGFFEKSKKNIKERNKKSIKNIDVKKSNRYNKPNTKSEEI